MLQKSPKLPKNAIIFQNDIFRGYNFSRILSKTAKSAKINTNKVFISLKIMVHILFVVKGVFPKDLEPVLIITVVVVVYYCHYE